MPLLILGACVINQSEKQQDVPVIKLRYDETKTVKMSDFVKSNNVILLDDTDETYIGNISKIDIVDSLIVVTDISTHAVLIYNFEGKLMNSIKKHGRGPEEFLSIQSTWVNPDTKEISIYDRSQHKILFFNLNGDFVRQMRSPPYICAFAFNSDEYSYFYRSMDGFPDDNMQPSNFHLLMTSRDSLRLDMKRDFFMDNASHMPYERFCRSKNAILLLTPQEQSIYELSGMTKKLKYRVELAPNPDWENENYRSIKTYQDFRDRKNTRMGNLGGLYFMASDRYMLFTFGKRRTSDVSDQFYAIYDMEKDQVKLSFRQKINDIEGFTGFLAPFFFNDSLWITPIHQYQIDNESLKAAGEYYSIDFSKSINPILVISKLNFNE